MPIYTFLCSKGHVTEDFKSINDRHETTLCSSPEVEPGMRAYDANCGAPTKRIPSRPTVQVVGGTPKHYPSSL